MHFREIAVNQAHDVETYEQVHEYQQIPAGNEHVYQYENGQIVTISGQIPQSGTVHLKREMVIEKEPNGVEHVNSNAVTSEPQAIYVELKNENNEALRYVHPPNGPMRYEMPERYYRYHHQIAPPHHHHLQHVREAQGKDNEGPQQSHEIQIYEPEQQSTQQQQQQQSHQQQNVDQQNVQAEQVQEQKTHYTNLEPVHSQNYYIAEGYSQGGNFTYLQAPTTTKEGYIYPGSPVLYKSELSFIS